MGATSEVGRLRTVLLHRPGPELRRLTPRNNDQLLFDGVPWVARAQEEHDAFAAGADRPRRRGALPRPAAGRDPVLPVRAGRADRRRRRRPAARRHPAARRDHAPGVALARGPRRHAHRRPRARRAARRQGPGLRGDGPRRLRRPPAAQPAVHPRLLGLGRRRGGRDVAGHARPAPREHDHRAPSTPTTRASPASSSSTAPGWSTSRAATSCCSPTAWWRSGSASGRRPAAPSGWPGGCSPAGWRTRCSSSPSPSSGRPCTWTPSRRWSTSTRWSCTPRSPTR